MPKNKKKNNNLDSKLEKKKQRKPYVFVREEIPELETFDGLTAKEVIYNSIIHAYKNTKGVLSRIADLERRKQNEVNKKTEKLVKDIIENCYKPLYVEDKNTVKLFVNPGYEDVLMKALSSSELRDYKIEVKPFGHNSIKKIYKKLPYLIYVKRRIG